MEIREIGVVGCGVMGAGIVHAAAVAGFRTRFVSRSKEKADRDLERVRQSIFRAVEKKKLTGEQGDAALKRVRGGETLDFLESCDIIIESIVEDLERKKEVFGRLDGILPSRVVLATNTSSFSVSEIGDATRRPGLVAGMHFFVPAQAMKLVEVVRGKMTTDQTAQAVAELARAMGKEPVTVKDTPGFIVNRMLVPYLNQAIQAIDDGLAAPEDIDRAVRLGFSVTLGPVSMLDLIGLDVQLRMSETLYAKSGDPRFAPPRLLRKMVEDGRLGRKTGRGFFEYERR
ncbi:MAG: 3-hydroxyacyl-CoA dehydrogenase NAD-binding domain-containing protein [bacterium]